MKHSIRTIFVILAIVMTFVSVRAAQAVEVKGTVTAIVHNTITVETLAGTVTVSSLGPRSYWRSEGISYPKVGDYVIVDAYDGASGYIAVSVTVCDLDCDCDEGTAKCIDLRDPDTLIPLWIRFQVTD